MECGGVGWGKGENTMRLVKIVEGYGKGIGNEKEERWRKGD